MAQLWALILLSLPHQESRPDGWQVCGHLWVWWSAPKEAERGLPWRKISREGGSPAQGETADEKGHWGRQGPGQVTGSQAVGLSIN